MLCIQPIPSLSASMIAALTDWQQNVLHEETQKIVH